MTPAKSAPARKCAALVLATLAGIAAAPCALAQEALAGEAGSILFSFRDDAVQRFASIDFAETGAAEPAHGVEVEFTAPGAALDISIAQRGSFGADRQGDLDRSAQGAEVRVGRGLAGGTRAAQAHGSRWYVFAASDDEALTWRPGARRQIGGPSAAFSLQERVEIGDLQAGITYERYGVEASLAYVEREISTTVGVESISRAENFAGFTLTMRR